jgi:hypothetical protein
MKTFSKDINVYCDIQKDICYCWGEGSVTLQWWQGKSVAFKIFKLAGWILSKEKDVCPYCSKGIKKSEYEDRSFGELIKNINKNKI